MELESSLPCSQESSAGPYSEPDHSNPYHPILSLSAEMQTSKLIFRVGAAVPITNRERQQDVIFQRRDWARGNAPSV
jgi:hypothetical protein